MAPLQQEIHLGIDTRSALVVGLPFTELTVANQEHAYEQDIENLERFAPYYDADHEDCIFGIAVARTRIGMCAEVPTGDIGIKVAGAINAFKLTTGQDPRLFVTADVS
jgi:hypothetical protein